MIYLIYKIHCNITGDDYYGSTKDLNNRMSVHKCDTEKQNSKHKCRSKEIINRGDYSVSVIETIEVETKQEALWRERYYIENYPSINDGIPIKTDEEIKARKKQYALDNKEYFTNIAAEHYKKNREARKTASSQYYAEHKGEINKKRNDSVSICETCGIKIKTHHLSRHEKTKQHKDCLASGKQYEPPPKQNDKTICECGGKYTHCHRSTHEKTKRHQDFINSK